MADKETNLPFGLCEQDAELLKSFHELLKSIRSLTISNIGYYQRGLSSTHARFYSTSCILLERTQLLEPLLIELVPRLIDFDFCVKVKANGYRSFVSITNRCCLHLLQLCRHININRTKLLFRATHYLKELEDYVETLGQLIACLGYLIQLISYAGPGELLVGEDKLVADDLVLEFEMLNTDCFYGRSLGFHFCESVQKLLPGILVAMATFSECYEENSQVMQLATSVFNSGKYVLDQDLRAKQVVDVTRTADVKFCKAFWSILESPLLSQLRSFTFPYVEVSEVMSLEPENFELPIEGSTDGATVTITPPCAHIGPAPVNVRLISKTLREGMGVTRKRFQPKTGSAKAATQPKSRALLFHCHGGGFVSQSSQSHENYLRLWACKLKIPILSVDYSLSPDLPFPRALEECFYAYAWALKNPEKLGWTGENICFAGDSAGGNLAVATALRAVSYEIRVPDGILAAYTPFLVQYTPSPSRLMSMIDPLLPVGILTRCIAAYAGIADEFSSALAKPIFCNPGNIETWEVVKEEDVGEDIADPATADNIEQTEAAVKSTADKAVINTNTLELSDCDSIEELDDEFVVCDMEEFEKDESHYAGEVVNEAAKHEGRETVENCHENNAKANEDQSRLEEILVSDKCTKQQPTGNDENEIKTTANETVSNEGVSVEDAIKDIDSHVVISVDTGSIENECVTETAESSSSYAICNELLDAAKSSTISDTRECKQFPDMMSTSCHSLEDLAEPGIDEVLVDGRQSVDTKLGAAGHMDKNTAKKKSLEYTKQWSVSDTSDSGIHVDTDEEKGCDVSPANGQNIDDNQCTDNSTVTGESEDTSNGSNSKKRAFTEPAKETPKHNLPKQRAFSLDLTGHCHPGHIGYSSPQDVLRSPVSPTLPKGSRSFTPKRFSVHRRIAQSPIQLFKHLPIVKNLYMSPLLAPDEFLKGLPTVYLMACHFDPLLDDSIVFAKKLRSLDRAVELHVFDSLPHGFLCFADVSLECKQAAVYCLETIQKVLNLEE